MTPNVPAAHAICTPRLRRHRACRRAGRGFTLIEMLVSLTITLIMMGAVVTLFQTVTDSVSGSRSLIELSDRLRNCRNRLQTDLISATATMKPPLSPDADEGYCEIIDGPANDATYSVGTLNFGSANSSIFGDVDDVLAFTVRSRGEPFVGLYNGTGTLESQVAEVIYFLAQSGYEPVIDPTPPVTRLYTLYRRVLLVSPGLNSGNPVTMPAAGTNYYDLNDISARYVTAPTTAMVANTLGDLTKRENRFGHNGAFPYNISAPTGASPAPSSNARVSPFTGVRLGDDVIMTNVVAFDVQVWDPNAPVFTSAGTPTFAVEPRDAGFTSLSGGTPTSYGAYVDLGYTYAAGGPTKPQFNGSLPAFQSVRGGASTVLSPILQIPATSGLRASSFTYDTWSLHYENDGTSQDAGGWRDTIDTGTNGLDDDGDGVVDNAGELETQAPFPNQIRGIKITVRAYEPNSQQVREITVIQDFLPE